MTQALRLTLLREFIPLTYSEGSYRMTISDFPDGCAVKTDALSGRQWGCGRNVFGEMISVPLNVPICSSCDQPITDHMCTDCELVFVGDEQ